MHEHGVVRSKWLLASALHKSIRRGHAEPAQKFAADLLSTEPSYLGFRLGTIALEEVGPGDWQLVAAVLDKIRARETAALPDLAGQLAQAVKSRTVCFAKVRTPGDTLALSPLLRFVSEYGAGFERLGLAVPHVAQLVSESESTEIVMNPPDEFGDEMIAGLPAATFDQHTREGKHAIASFAKVVQGQFTVEQIAWAVFVVEGQHIDRELCFDGLDALRSESIEAGFRRRGITPRDQVRDLANLVRRNRKLLNHARRRVTQRLICRKP
jgi:hypothetical protein